MNRNDSVAVLRELVDRFPEINPSNYDHDDACALNAWGVEVCAAIDALSAQGAAVAEVIPNVVGVEIAWSNPPSHGRPPVGTKLYLHPAPPGSDAVTEEMVRRASLAYEAELDGQVYGPDVPEVAMRVALEAALAARTGKGEA